tara:strand:+ start:1887 stop:2288 length:402 start_codon:yes stop_codon:yes gene_type:complete
MKIGKGYFEVTIDKSEQLHVDAEPVVDDCMDAISLESVTTGCSALIARAGLALGFKVHARNTNYDTEMCLTGHGVHISFPASIQQDPGDPAPSTVSSLGLIGESLRFTESERLGYLETFEGDCLFFVSQSDDR